MICSLACVLLSTALWSAIGMIYCLGVISPGLFIARINEHLGFLTSLVNQGKGCCGRSVWESKWMSSGPLHPYIWKRERDRGVFLPPWELITALFPISRMVTSSRLQHRVALRITPPPPLATMPKLPPPLRNGLLLPCEEKPLIFLITRRAQNYYRPHFHLSHFALCWWRGLFEVVAELQV